MTTAVYTVEDVTAQLQITPRTLHYYEEIGLIPTISRTEGGHRQYDQATVDRLEHILRLKRVLGSSLQEISVILEAENNLEQLRAQYTQEVSQEEKHKILEQGAALLRTLVDSIDHKMDSLEKLRGKFQQRLDNVQHLLDNDQ